MTNEMVCTPETYGDPEGLIDPSQFPFRAADLDTSAIETSADNAKTMGDNVAESMDTVEQKWQGLSEPYQTPEQDDVLALMDPAVTSAGDLNETLTSVHNHLGTYASTLSGIKTRLQDCETRASSFRNRVISGVTVDRVGTTDARVIDYLDAAVFWTENNSIVAPWYEDSDTVAENTGLLEEYAGLLEEITTAASDCANSINGLIQGYTGEEHEGIPAEAFTHPDADMPWGAPREEERNCHQSVGHGASNFGSGLAEGAGMLIGRDPETGEFSWGTAGQAWGGMGNSLGSLALTAITPPPVQYAIMEHTDDNWMRDRLETGYTVAGSFIAYDYQEAAAGGNGWHAWQEDGVAAFTESFLNIGTMFIPVAGAGGAVVRTGVQGTRLARVTNIVSEVMIPGGSWITNGGFRAVDFAVDSVRATSNVPIGSIRPNIPGAATHTMPSGASNPRPVSNDVFGPGARSEATVPSGAGRSTTGTGDLPAPGNRGNGSSVEAPSGSTARGDAANSGTGNTSNPSGNTPSGPGSRADSGSTGTSGTDTPGGGTGRGDSGHGTSGADNPNAGNGRGGSGNSGGDGSAPGGAGRGDGPELPRDADGWNNLSPENQSALLREQVDSGQPISAQALDNMPQGARDELLNVINERTTPAHQGSGIADNLLREVEDPNSAVGERVRDAIARDNAAGRSVELPDYDVPSSSGATNSGRLIEGQPLPDELQNLVDDGTLRIENDTLRLSEPLRIEFDGPALHRNPGEATRQLSDQASGLNRMTPEQLQTNLDNFTYGGRQNTTTHDVIRDIHIEQRADQLEQFLDPDAARGLANHEASGQVLLHAPDQIGGGNPLGYAGMGDRSINGSIGPSWRGDRRNLLQGLVNRVAGNSSIPSQYLGDIKINVDLVLK